MPRKILGSWKFNAFACWNAPKVGDEVVLRARRIAKQGCSKQSAMGLLDGDSQRSRLASQFSHNSWFKVTHEELGH